MQQVVNLLVLCVIAPATLSGCGSKQDVKTASPVSSGQSVVERRTIAMARAKPLETEAAEALEQGDYKRALTVLDLAEQAWKDQGLEPSYGPARADAYLGLEEYQEVLDSLDSRHLNDTMSSTAAALALLKLGKAKDARKLYQDQFITRHLPSLSYRTLPSKETDKEFEGTLWLARGIDSFVAGSGKRAEHDLFLANSLVPNQPLTCYFIGKLYQQFGKSSDAKRYFKVASKLPGQLGDEAKAALKS